MLTLSFAAVEERCFSSFPSKCFEFAPAVNLLHVEGAPDVDEAAFTSDRADGPDIVSTPDTYNAAFPLPGLEAGMRLAMTEVERGMI